MTIRKSARILALSFLFSAIASSSLANTQSKDRDNPTRLTSNEISGVIDSDSKGNIYYYSFMAGPGEVSITLTVEPGRQPHPTSIGLKTVIFTLFDRNAETLASKEAATYDGGDPKQVIARVEVTRRQLMTLSVKIPGGSIYEGVGKYRLRINGAVEFSQNGSTTVSRDKTDSGDQQAREFLAEAEHLLAQKKYIKAIENYTMAISLDPNNAENAYRGRGTAKLELKEYQEAIADFNEVIRIYFALQAEKKAKNRGASTREVEFATIGLPGIYNNRGFAKNRLGDKVGACNDFREACELDGRHCENYRKLCN